MANGSVKKGQFIEIDYTARVNQSGEVFDTTIKENTANPNVSPDKVKSVILCVGEGMILKGLDKEFEGKEIGKQYSVILKPKDAFGERKANLIKIIPLNVFKSKGVMPYPGLVLNMDGMIARISAVSGGRVITDFNNPLSGKDITYEFIIRKIIINEMEKLNCLVAYFLKEDPKKAIKEIKDKKAVIETRIKWPDKFIEEISKKVNDLTGLKIEVKSLKA